MENQKETPKRLHDFSLDAFKASINAMIATSDSGYRSIYEIGRLHRVKEYNEEEIKRIIDSGTLQ